MHSPRLRRPEAAADRGVRGVHGLVVAKFPLVALVWHPARGRRGAADRANHHRSRGLQCPSLGPARALQLDGRSAFEAEFSPDPRITEKVDNYNIRVRPKDSRSFLAMATSRPTTLRQNSLHVTAGGARPRHRCHVMYGIERVCFYWTDAQVAFPRIRSGEIELALTDTVQVRPAIRPYNRIW